MTATIAYLGPKGTYTEKAAATFGERLGTDYTLVPHVSFPDIFDSVSSGACEYGVVGMENSLEGPVTVTLDTFASRTGFTILGEQILDINHCLVAHPDAVLYEITTVASHRQGIAQCRDYLRRNFPDAKQITTSSTAEAARMVMMNKSLAGIANAGAASLYGAKVIEEGIQDHDADQTSFALIARADHPAVFTGTNYKTSLALFLKANQAGALMSILSEFAFSNINLTKIQSRPTKEALGTYMFFIDVEGSVEDEAMRIALECLKLKLREVRILGSYPIS